MPSEHKNIKVLILGATGMLGHKLVHCLSEHFEVYSTIRGSFYQVEKYGIFRRERIVENVDATDATRLEKIIAEVAPDIVINAVGVVKQLPSAKDVITTLELNSILPQRLAILSKKFGFRLILFSTDCVFDGGRGMYNEQDTPNALDLYGKSKQLGEISQENVLTIRSSIIGRELNTSHSLIEWFLSNRGGRVFGYTTAIYSGFPTIVIADIIKGLIVDHPSLCGVHHIASEPINKYELLGLVDEFYDAAVEIEPSDQLVIDRSLDGSAFNSITGFQPEGWPAMIQKMAEDKTPYDDFHR
ncbi:MAG TPA: SDR family oxidoreductase [Pyrinomonadaceae bacterium]|nr:SDR family oxidoreductase [Pyrinomonadaceae bacterium]